MGYKYPLLYPLKKYLAVNIASLPDIAATKINTIASRGAKKDFIDLYFICQGYYSLKEKELPAVLPQKFISKQRVMLKY